MNPRVPLMALDADQAADFLDCDPGDVRDWFREGVVPTAEVQGERLASLADLVDFGPGGEDRLALQVCEGAALAASTAG